jgi:hypothetical protein
MNPKDFAWTEEQQITVTNPTAETFTWKVHGKEYQLAAGKTAQMPGFIAWLYVYGQSVKAAQADGKFGSWNDEGFKQTYYDRFFVGADELIKVVEEEPELVQVIDVGEADPDEPAPLTGTNYVSKFDKKKANGGRYSKV